MGDANPVAIVLIIVFLVLSLAFHEAAHGWVALKCGDPTARDMGRITLNPIPHIDPFMTIILPTILLLTSPFIFGGAKPVPVNFYNLRKPYRDMALVALAGPVSNFLLAILFAVVFKVFIKYDFYTEDQLAPRVIETAVYFNILLATFNLLPIPPLDGSRIMAWILPPGIREPYVQLERFGMILVFVLIVSRVLNEPIIGAMLTMYDAVNWIASAGGAW